MKRLDVIDGMRGYFLVFMLINHLVFTGGLWLVQINHRNLAFVEDAQGFVFLSGLLTGMVYARKMMKDGYAVGRDRVWSRALELYRYAMGVVLAILVLQLVLPGAAGIWQNWLGGTHLDNVARLSAIGAFLFQPTFMDILPQYIIYLALSPMVIWLCINGRWAAVAIASLLIWLAGQLGLHRALTYPLNEWLAGAPDKEGLRASFNLLGWQIVFFAGVVAGSLTSMKRIDWKQVFNPEDTFLAKMALAVCLFFLPLRILTAHELMPGVVLEKFGMMEVRADFGLVYLVNFAAAAYGLSWLLIAGPRHVNPIVRKIASVLTGVFSLSYLQLLGRHSLQIYVWHVLIAYLVFYVDGRVGELSQLTKTIVAIGSLALLSLPAIYREREKLFGVPATQPAR
ncbi:OpgC domain-containing protein [Rhizobium cremeum]|uniref:OpgC family protein n=1 Tax=Rhizobium cremeum TaxID=2813827 RepID=UPI000DE09C60|nr:OpgC domain-containing protein [Rhizobium cremeum]MCJ7993482.1 OpgC domain-containing protein [Rhizobium cremeum]MCJ7998539.1 OpgC domain-containing protein [Rhizobium cremeum]